MNIKAELVALEVAYLSDPLITDEKALEDFRVLSRKVVYGSCEAMEAFYLEHSARPLDQIITAMNDYQALRGSEAA